MLRMEGEMADQASFDEFYLGTRGHVLRQLTAMTADSELAADVVQEAYARAWQRWSRVSGLESPPAWVRTVAWRIAVSHYRRAAVADRLLARLGRRPEVDPDFAAELGVDLERALHTLSPEHRRVLVLHEMVGLSVLEIAQETGVAEGTVKSRLSRARARLARPARACLRHPGDTEPAGSRSPSVAGTSCGPLLPQEVASWPSATLPGRDAFRSGGPSTGRCGTGSPLPLHPI
jgi:RNA polymerase sigma-70 factor (ECF subfamily)